MKTRPFFILEIVAFLLVMPWASKSALGEPNVPGYIVETYASVPVPQTLSFDDQTGVLYVGNGASQPASIYRISPDQHIVSPYGGPILDPDAVICDPYGHTWSGEFFGPGTVLVGGGPDLPGHISAIRQDESTVIIFESNDFENPTDMAFDSTGRLLFVDWDARGVFQTSGEDPNILFPTPARPYNIAVHPDDDRIFVSTEEGTIRIYGPNGTLLDDNFATGLPTYLNGIPLAFGPGGVWGTDLYVIGHNLRRYDAGGNNTIIGTGFGTNHVDMTFGPDGSLYVSGNISAAEEGILRITPEPPKTYHVDCVNGDNSNDGLRRETAFATIQKGINSSDDGDTVLVWPGVYNETATQGINFKGKAITVKSAADAAVLEVPGFVAATFIQGEDGNSVLSNFVVRGSTAGIFALFANPTISNVTIVDNDNGVIADNANPSISNSIFWNNINGDLFGSPDPITAQYSFVQDEFEANLVAYWKLDGDANDSAGNNDGTIYGATPTTGQIGEAYNFDGDDDSIEVADTDTLRLANTDFTLSSWIYKTEFRDTRVECILAKRIAQINGGWIWSIGANLTTVGLPGSVFYQVSGGDDPYINSTGTISLNKWQFVAITYKFSSKTLRIYINGVLDTTGTIPSPNPDISVNLKIGQNTNLVDYDFKGLIDEVRIYGRSLSAVQIEAMYEAGLAGIIYGEPGFADANGGDYHLLSERGRYRATTDEWILDEVTSPCVDSGDPNVNPSNERMPNGGRINMGAYGNTAYASMSEWPIKGDDNNDGRFDFIDIAILLDGWLQELPWAE